MKQVFLGVCLMDEDGSVFTTRKIGTEWSVDLEVVLKSGPNKYFYSPYVPIEINSLKLFYRFIDEISAIMTENLTRNLKSDKVQEMLKEILEKDWE